MNSIHQELKLIIEDELFDIIGEAIGPVTALMDVIAKVDLTLSFVSYLRSLPGGVEICRPQILDKPLTHAQDDDASSSDGAQVFMRQGYNPLLLLAR